MLIKRHGVPVLLVLLVLAGVMTATAQPAPKPMLAPMGTAFTYQGYLDDGGNPADGSYNLRFSLWNALTEGAQVGVQTKIGVPITDGLFQVTLNFGPVFDGTSFWLVWTDFQMARNLFAPSTVGSEAK